MELMDLIQMAGSAADVLAHLRAYCDTLADAAALPQWWLQLPLENAEHAQERMVALVAIVNGASRQLDERRRNAGKQALQVFAIGVWKLRPRGARWRPGPYK